MKKLFIKCQSCSRKFIHFTRQKGRVKRYCESCLNRLRKKRMEKEGKKP